MGVKVQRKFYFLVVSNKVLICLDDGTSTPIDNPSGFSGRSSIPNSANCIELKPNLPNSFDGFCPNSEIVLPDKSYTDYDQETETLIINKAVSDGNCGYTMQTTKIQLKTTREYNLYVRAIMVFPVIVANYATTGGTIQAQPIRVAFFDVYYYVFSDLNSATNWDLSKLMHSTSQLISPFSFGSSGGSLQLQRANSYLRLSNPNINNKYKVKDIPPSVSFNDSYYYNAGSTNFGRYDPDILQNSHTYIRNYYDILPENNDIMFDWRPPGINSNFNIRLMMWPLVYDKITDYSTYSRAILESSADPQVVAEALGLLNSAWDPEVPIYGARYAAFQINAIQYYPLEPLPKTFNNTYRNLYPDERFYWPPGSGTSWSRCYFAVPALYRSYASGQVVGPHGEQVSKIKNTLVRVHHGTTGFETIYGAYDFPNGKFWSVDENCNLVYLEDDLSTVAGVERRIITHHLPPYRRVYVSSFYPHQLSLPISISLTPVFLGNGVVQWLSMKYAIDLIYTVTLSSSQINVADPITVRPPAVCPPSSLPVMANNMAYIAD